MKKGPFNIRLDFEDKRIVDTGLKDIEELDNIFKDIKKKFK